jgi:hypothetical protein
MIIKHIDGTEVDTDKLPDIDAQIFEKIEELRVLCETSNRICLLLVDTKGQSKLTTFWNLKSGPIVNDATVQKSFAKLAHAAHSYFMGCSQGNLGVFPTSAIDPNKLNINNNDE